MTRCCCYLACMWVFFVVDYFKVCSLEAIFFHAVCVLNHKVFPAEGSEPL